MLGERWLKAAYSYLYIRDFARAVESFEKAIEADPTNPDYYFRASVTALRNDDVLRAKNWAQSAVHLAPANPLFEEHLAVVEAVLLMQQGEIAEREGRYDSAFKLYEEAYTRDPLNHDAERACARLACPGAETGVSQAAMDA